MSHTIYGGTSKNGIFVSDMVDNGNDYIFRLSEGSKCFLRLTTWWENEDMTGQYGVALAGFHEKDPFEVLWAKKIDLTPFQCESEDEEFAKVLHETLIEFAAWYIKNNDDQMYEIRYIDGETLKYRKYQTFAENEDDAIKKLKESYSWGDFDHHIISVTHIIDKDMN